MKKQLFIALCLTLSSANLFCPAARAGTTPPSGGGGGQNPPGGGGGSTVTIANVGTALTPTEQKELLAALGTIATQAAGGTQASPDMTTLATSLVQSGTGTLPQNASKQSNKLGRMSSRKKRA